MELSENANVHKYFILAREREKIKRMRLAGLPKPWTTDPIFANHRFCNVHREDDKTTAWFRENIRDKLRDMPEEALAATVAFRWFNKIETGEIIKPFLLGNWSSEAVSERLLGVSPVVTGAYIIKTPDGMNKLTGVLTCIDWFLENMKKGKFDSVLSGKASQETACNLFQESPFLGKFMAYQIVADIRFTCLLENAPDIMTWAQPGPGSTRGIGRIFYGDVNKFNYGSPRDEKEVVRLMQELLLASKELGCNIGRPWEMQVIQNWACETDKYFRCEEGGRMKRKFS